MPDNTALLAILVLGPTFGVLLWMLYVYRPTRSTLHWASAWTSLAVAAALLLGAVRTKLGAASPSAGPAGWTLLWIATTAIGAFFAFEVCALDEARGQRWSRARLQGALALSALVSSLVLGAAALFGAPGRAGDLNPVLGNGLRILIIVGCVVTIRAAGRLRRQMPELLGTGVLMLGLALLMIVPATRTVASLAGLTDWFAESPIATRTIYAAAVSVCGFAILFIVFDAERLAALRAERQRAAAEHELALALDTATDPVFLADGDGRLRQWNRQFGARAARVTPGLELDGASIAEFAVGAQRDDWRRAIADAMRDGTALVEGEGDAGSGAVEDLLLSAIRREGETAGLIGFIRDTSELRRMQSRLLAFERLEVLGRMSSGIAHDFNNTIQVIMVCAQTARLGLQPGDPAVEDIEGIVAACQRATVLTRQLLMFARRESAPPSLVNLAERVQELQHMLKRLLGERVRLRLDLQASDAWVLVDAGHFDQALINLAANARDAMPEGGELAIAVLREPASGPRPRGHSHAVLTVTDTGSGIAPDVLPRIFDPFFTTKAAGFGTGLGLPSVQGFVVRAGGSITVDSTPGTGTTFRIALPLASEGVVGLDEAPAVTRAS